MTPEQEWVDDLVEKARADEREACARAAEERSSMYLSDDFGEGYSLACADIAAAIRKRGTDAKNP